MNGLITISKQKTTTELEELEAKRAQVSQTVGAITKDFGLIEQPPRNWGKAEGAGELAGDDTKAGAPVQMDLFQLWAEYLELKRENLR